MGSAKISTSGQLTPLEQSEYPLAFVAANGTGTRSGDAGGASSLRCEVMGLGRFQKEGLVTDLADGRSWRLTADEGKYLRGTDMAPAPLMHWAAGLHGDVTARIARLAVHAGIHFTGLEVDLIQGFASKGSFARGEAVGLVFDLHWQIKMQTEASLAGVESLVDQALRSSPAVGALTGELDGAFALSVNGSAMPVVGVPQSNAPGEIDPFRHYSARPIPADIQAPAGEILWRQESPGTAAQELPDDLSGTIAWHVRAMGSYHLDSGLVESAIDFPGAGSSQWTLVSDESNTRAPSPLAYFSMGTAFCYHTQLCRYVDVRRLPVSSPRLVQTSTFLFDDKKPTAEPFDTQLFINGSVNEAQAKSLLTAAANTCYAHRALAESIKSTHKIQVTTS